MIAFTSKLMNELESQLQQTAVTANEELELAETSFQLADRALEQLKSFMRTYEFADEAEEIHFFKQVKPSFHKLFIYYAELIYVHATRPTGDRKHVIAYYRQLLLRNGQFIERHKLLYGYYKLGRDSEDVLLFLRRSACPPLYPAHEKADIDTAFCTVSGSILAKLMAYELMNNYLNTEIEKIKEKSVAAATTGTGKTPRIVWTDSQADFVELIYALYARGSINHGKITIKELMSILQDVFNLRVEHYYRIYAELSLRKKSRTAFIQSLGEYLERRMDDAL